MTRPDRARQLQLTVERPVAGGRMLARHEGRIVLVSGAIPGERVVARVEDVSRKVVFAATVDVIEASPERRVPPFDPVCGGLAYAHMTPEGQRRCKAEVIRDAFRRIGRRTIEEAISVAASPEQGYRLRGRLHVQHGRAGLYVERSHQLCDASRSGQFHAVTLDAVDNLLRHVGNVAGIDAIVVAENVEASERVAHLELVAGADGREVIGGADAIEGLTGVTCVTREQVVCLWGRGRVTDTSATLCGQTDILPASLTWTRSAASFFQGNRFLTGTLLLRVLDAAVGARVLDLYAGVGLFSLGLAARGATVTAVEGDRASVADLEANADQYPATLTPRHSSVEAAVLTAAPGRFDAIVIDPPRTGATPEVVSGIAGLGARRIVYVSCDPPTLARDSALLAGSGYALTSIEAFDLFPNTAHVEALAVFEPAAGA